jgi:DNA-binding transcriptional MerR regulator
MIHNMTANLRAVPADAPDEYTIDQLAQASGVTVRNIRAHQSRGLLPAPEVRGRTGFYTREHVARLQLINEMQTDGFNLNAIKRILDGMPPGSAGEVLGFERALRTPWGDEEPEILTGDELGELYRSVDDKTTQRAIKLGIIRPLGDGRFEVPSPALLRAGAELEKFGIPLDTRLAVQEQIHRHTEGVADSFVRLFVERVWKPFNDAGRPESEWPRVHDALNQLRPLATEALVATFHQVMSVKVDEAFGKVIQQEAKTPRKPKPEQRERPRERHKDRARPSSRRAEPA